MRRAAEVTPDPPAPVLSPESFLALCRMPPLQVRGGAGMGRLGEGLCSPS